MTGSKSRRKLGRLGDQGAPDEIISNEGKTATTHDEIEIPSGVGEGRTNAQPAPIDEVRSSRSNDE